MFYKSRWFYIIVVCICVGGLSFYSGSRIKINKSNQVLQQNEESKTIVTNSQDIVKNNITQSEKAANTPKHKSVMEQAAAEGKIKIADAGGTYPWNEWIVMPDNDIAIKVEDFYFSYLYGDNVHANYIYVVDFNISNDTDCTYSWSYEDFRLRDKYGYIYNASLGASTKGIRSGIIQPGKSQKAELGFELSADLSKNITPVNYFVAISRESGDSIYFYLNSEQRENQRFEEAIEKNKNSN